MRALPSLDDDAVTPVVGTLMILGITVLGITTVLFWGMPELEKLDQRGAMAGMTAEFQQIRADLLRLDLTDQANVPGIQLERGSLALVEGTRTMVTAMFDTGDADCDMHVDDWGVGAATDTITVTFTGCGTGDIVYIDDDVDGCQGTPCFHVHKVSGPNLISYDLSTAATGSISTAATAQVTIQASRTVNAVTTAADFTTGDWRFMLSDVSGTETGATAHAYLLSTKALDWSDRGRVDQGLRLENGALFSRSDGAFFLAQAPRIQEEATAQGELLLDLPALVGDTSAVAGRSTPSMYMGLLGQYIRTSETAVWSVRFDFEGTYAEAWCNTLDLRDQNIGLLYSTYAPDASYPCASGGTDGRRSVIYTYDPPGGGSPELFPFEFIHERITTIL